MKGLLCVGVVAFFGAAATAPMPPPTALQLPDGERGIGFDDLRFSSALNRLLVPSGRTGRLNLVDPQTRGIESVEGFSSSDRFEGGHGAGTTSADSGHGFIFASDRGRRVVEILDVATMRRVGKARLGGGPDYVRWVGPGSEVWVTEPGRERIEYFTFRPGDPPTLADSGTITVSDGPESLVIDATRGRAYTHTWHDTTLAIDLRSHRVVAKWPNSCEGSRGIALDENRGFLFVGCEEGKAVALDVAHDGRPLGTAKTGGGVDIIAYGERPAHLYVPGGYSQTMTIIAIHAGGEMKVLGTVKTAPEAHCVAADDLGNVYVCDPHKGRLLVYADGFPAGDR